MSTTPARHLLRAKDLVDARLSTDDVQASYEEMKSRGVEFQQEPTQQPYGIDAGFEGDSPTWSLPPKRLV